MAFDALTLHAIRDELDRAIVGGRIDSVALIDERTLSLEVYNRHRSFVLISANPSDPRVYLTQDRPPRGTDAVTPLLLLMRKYIRGGRVVSVQQPRLERLLTIEISARMDDGTIRLVELRSELMGRRSNVVLVDEDSAIMDALIRLPPSVNPSRPLLPHLRYTPPNRELKSDPLDPGLGSVLRSRAEAAGEGDAWRLIVSTVAGFSPLAAREAIARAVAGASADSGPQERAAAKESVRVKDAPWEAIAEAIRLLAAPVDNGGWEPSIAWLGSGALDYAPYVLQQFRAAEVRDYGSMSEALIAVGGAERIQKAAPFASLRRPLLDAIADRIDLQRRKRGSLERSLAMADEADSLREAGEAILANAAQIKEGDVSLTWNGRRIDLYPSLSAVENAQSYFRQYTSARDAKRVVPPLLDEVEGELGYLDGMALHVETSENERDINALRRELEATGIVQPPRRKKGASTKAKTTTAADGVVRRLSVDGAQLLVGGSAAGNETVTFRLGRPEDLWFHVRGRPGAHVILRAEGQEVQERWIREAAQIAAARSAGRNEGRVEVDYTQRKHVRKISGALPGRVTYRNETTILVEPTNAAAAGERKTG